MTRKNRFIFKDTVDLSLVAFALAHPNAQISFGITPVVDIYLFSSTSSGVVCVLSRGVCVFFSGLSLFYLQGSSVT